jgi:hypothetical protein
LTEWIPDQYRGLVRVEVWWLFELVAALAVLVAAGYLLRGVFRKLGRALAGRPRQQWDSGLREDLASYPAVNGPPSLCVYQVPGWVRLVVVAPLGKARALDPRGVPDLLDRAVPVLGEAVRQDLPRALVWPAQMSEAGFANAFHRCTPTGRREGEATGWLVLAGRVELGRESLLVGLVLWTQEPTTTGRMNLEPRQWLDVLRPPAAGAGG